MGLNLSHGGHLTHGSPVNFSGNTYNFISYGVLKNTGRVDFDDVLGEVQMRSASGELSQIIANGKTKYQASVSYPGLLEQIEPNGIVTVGMFKNGEFVADLSND